MVDTVRDLIRRAMRLGNIIEAGEVPDADEYQDALGTLNDMLDAWSLESLILPYNTSVEYQVVAGQKVYEIGPSAADWVGVRPLDILSANIRVSGNLDIPVEILETQQYQNIPVKDVTSTQSTSMYYDAQVPNGYISLYPVPNAVFGLVLIYTGVFQQVTLDTPLTGFAAGLVAAIRFNLCIDLCGEYNKKPADTVAARAVSYKAAVKSMNCKALDAVFDYRLPSGAGRAWDWRIG